jgi:gliding motility-associated-like protein
MNLKTYILLLLFSINPVIVFAQLNPNIIGDAIIQGNNCFTITPDMMFQAGGVYYNNPIDFSEDFTIYYQSGFGSKDFDGADGMAIVFKRDFQPQLGNAGGGLSYQGILTSLIVEFDTWQNFEFGDPAFDHISIMKNGDANHTNPVNSLAGPVQASATSGNIEDGNTHEVKIEWSADQQLFVVYFDCIIRLQINLDIKNLIFGGDDSIYFGFVGSTGGSSNVHQVCLNRVSFVDNLQLQDKTICNEGSIEIDATIASGVSYSWSPIDGVSDPNIANPSFSPDETTTYTVTIPDVCGDVVVEDVTVSVLPFEDVSFDEVNPICAGDELQELPLISNNGISGFWSPQLNNTTTTTYTFIPTSNPCVNLFTLEIVVNPLQIPSISPGINICEGDTLAELPTTSSNGISGTWSPELDNTVTTIYTFTPNPDEECAVSRTLEIIVNPLEVPQFDVSDSICEGEFISLPTISINGITGRWTPELNTTTTTTYTFTPSEDQCATEVELVINVNTRVTPIFDAIDVICEGDALSDLPTTSNNGITGIWSPEINNTTTTLYTFIPLDSECASETTIEIEVTPSVIPIFNYPITSICPGEALEALPAQSINEISGTWSPEFNNQLTTAYTFTPNLDEICAIETTIVIIVTEPILPIFVNVQSICVGDILDPLPQISTNGITGTWFPELDNTITTNYTFTPDTGQCAIQTTLEIEVLPIRELTIAIIINSVAFANNQSVTVNVTGGTGSYEYQLDDLPWQIENSFNRIRGCEEHIIKVRELSRCSNIPVETFRILEYPKFFTPNGDTENEIWNIDCLRDQIGAKVTIFNRYGKVITTIDPSRFGWNGLYNDSLMPSSDYWFKAEYVNSDGTPQTFVSHFSLKR